MSIFSTFKDFYDSRLMPELLILEQERKKIIKRVLTIGLITVALIVLLSVFMPSGASPLRGFLQVASGVIGFIMIGVASRKYRLHFKTQIISKITGFVDESLTYSPESGVSKYEFVNSSIFLQSCDYFRGEDHFQGKVDKTTIEFSEIVAKHRTTSGTGSERKERYTTIFKGVFFVADFNKNFKTRTLVLPDTAEKLFGKFGQKLQSMSFSRGELVRLEDPEFEKAFCVYGDDQVEARYILSPALMRRILEFKEKWNSTIYLSFVDSKVYIAIRLNKNLFETRLFKSIVDYAFIEESVKYLILLIGIVEDLNLNTRIWTKG